MMEKEIMTAYTKPGGAACVEIALWKQVGMGNPNGVPLPGETGLWKIMNVRNPARDLTGLAIPSIETFKQIIADEDGNQSMVDVPMSVQMDPAYWDYYNLPLKPGVTIP